jgi:hypothetical protein
MHLFHLVHERDQQEEPRAFRAAPDTSQTEDHTPLVLLDYLDRTNEDDRDYDHHDNGDGRDSYPRRLQ